MNSLNLEVRCQYKTKFTSINNKKKFLKLGAVFNLPFNHNQYFLAASHFHAERECRLAVNSFANTCLGKTQVFNTNQVSSKYHPNTIQVLSEYHQSIIQVSSKCHPSIIQILTAMSLQFIYSTHYQMHTLENIKQLFITK